MMKAGDLVFVRTYGVVGNLIAWLTRSKFSHIAIAVSESQIFEAQYGEVSGIYDFNYTHYEIVPMNLTDDQRVKLVDFIKNGDAIGRQYDTNEIIGLLCQIIATKVFDLINIDVVKYFNSLKKFICIEAVLYCYSKGLDITLVKNEPTDLVLFNDLYNNPYALRG